MIRAAGKEKEKKKEEKRKEPKEKRRKKKSKRNIYIIPTVLYPARAEATFRSELFLTFNFPDSRNLFGVNPKDRNDIVFSERIYVYDNKDFLRCV